MRQFVLDYLVQQCGEANQIANYRRETDDADLLITRTDGKRIGICVINRAIRLPEIKERYEHNATKGIHTLYIMDGRMMPQDNSAVEPPYWMAALHTLMYGRIYAYWCEGREVTIRPFPHGMEMGRQPAHSRIWRGHQPQRDFREPIYPATKYIDGAYLSATFGEGSFWTKRQPMEERRFNYSWRNWTYGERKQRSEEPEEPAWDPWEEFNNSYAGNSTGEGEWEWTGEEFRQRQPRRAEWPASVLCDPRRPSERLNGRGEAGVSPQGARVSPRPAPRGKREVHGKDGGHQRGVRGDCQADEVEASRLQQSERVII